MVLPAEFQLTFVFSYGVSSEYELVSQTQSVVSRQPQAHSEHWFLPQPLNICASWTRSPPSPESLFQFIWVGARPPQR